MKPAADVLGKKKEKCFKPYFGAKTHTFSVVLHMQMAKNEVMALV